METTEQRIERIKSEIENLKRLIARASAERHPIGSYDWHSQGRSIREWNNALDDQHETLRQLAAA